MYIRLIKHISIFFLLIHIECENGRKPNISPIHIRQIQEEMQMFARCSGTIVRITLDIHTNEIATLYCMFISFYVYKVKQQRQQ